MASPPPIRNVAVIIVNYGTAELAAAAVDSVLFHQRHQASFSSEIHLVDNASPGDDALYLQEAHLEREWGRSVHLYLEMENHGFGRGNNRVLEALSSRATPPDAVFLLNPDAVLKNDALEHLVAFLDACPTAGFAGAKIEEPGNVPAAAAFRFPGVVSEFSLRLAFGPICRLLRAWDVPLSPELPQQRVDWVSGAAVLARFEVLEQVGYFDPDFFLYFEEVDLMRRARTLNWETWYVPSAQVEHIGGAATGVRNFSTRPPRRPAYYYQSWRLYFTKSQGRFTALITAIGAAIGGIFNMTITAVIPGRERSIPKAFLRDHWGLVIRPLLGLPEHRARG